MVGYNKNGIEKKEKLKHSVKYDPLLSGFSRPSVRLFSSARMARNFKIQK
jgi:hypothetical protein